MVRNLLVFLLCGTITFVRAHQQIRGGYSEGLLDSPISTTGNRRLNLNCPTPSLLYYKADIDVHPYYQTTCTAAEIAYIGQRINYHWNNYVAYSSVLGPIQIDNGNVCASAKRRHLIANETESSDNQPRRRLKNGFGYDAGGRCEYCGGDDDDDRRRKLASPSTPVTFEVDSDKFPHEMGFEVYDQYGSRVIHFSSFDRRYTRRTITYDLHVGQTYQMKMLDGYGDGWCCYNGYGGMRIYLGNPGSGMDLITHFSGVFGSAVTHDFTVPNFDMQGRSAGYEAPDVVFPELESSISSWVTYYIQQEFHWDRYSCLYGAAPNIWADLSKSSQAESQVC